MDLKTKGSDLFADVVSNAKEFVEKQKGKWDHTKWEGFLADIQKKGVSLTDDTTNALGSVLESLKKLYAKFPVPNLDEVISNAKEFVEKQKGKWDHTKWEGFLADIQKKGVSLTDDVSSTIGSILESLKKFYTVLPESLKGEEKPKEEDEQQPVKEAKAAEITQQEETEAEALKEAQSTETVTEGEAEMAKQEPAEAAQEEQATETTQSTKTVTEGEAEMAKQETAEAAQEEQATETTQSTETVTEGEAEMAKHEPVEAAQEEQVPEPVQSTEVLAEVETEVEAAQEEHTAEKAGMDEEQKTESAGKSKKRGTAKKSTRGRSKKSAESDTAEGEQHTEE